MAYCTIDDLNAKYGSKRIAQLSGDAVGDHPDTDKIMAAIEDADATIDAYLQKLYTTPLTDVPKFIANLSRELAMYELKKTTAGGISDKDEDHYKSILKLLGDVAQGKISLGIAVDDAVYNVQPAEPFITKERLFGRLS
jgi:phage gp36-like protein